jgi:hypothetical protein
MNLWWELFGVAETALGGWIANGARLLTVALAILLTIYKDRIWKPVADESDWLADDDCSSSNRNTHRQRIDAEVALEAHQRLG